MFHCPKKYEYCRYIIPGYGIGDSTNGAFKIAQLRIIASDGKGWEHVSVSGIIRTPTWAEMCFVKSLFWDDEDVVVQYHPAKSNYVNISKNCLHLWRPVGAAMPTPPVEMV